MRSPYFEREFQKRIEDGQDNFVLPSRILRKKVPDTFQRGLRWSLACHGSMLVLYFFWWALGWMFGDTAEMKKILAMKEMNTAIRVEAIALPSHTIQELQKVDVFAEIEKEAKAKEQAAKEQMILPKKTDEKKKESTVTKAKNKENGDEKRLAEIRKSLSANARRKELIEGLRKKGGRKELAGNILSDGYATQGDVATEADAYAGLVRQHGRQFWNVPAWMQSSALSASVHIKVAPDGRIISKDFIKKSGNPQYDEEIMRTVELASPLPKPPENIKILILEEGMEWKFPN